MAPKVNYPTDPSHPYSSEGSPVPKQYRDLYAAIILRALTDILDTGRLTLPYFWFKRRGTANKSNIDDRSNTTTPRASAIAWIFHSDTFSERPSFTLEQCCEVVGVEPVEVQRHAAKLIQWQKLGLANGDSPNVADNIGIDKIYIDTRAFRRL